MLGDEFQYTREDLYKAQLNAVNKTSDMLRVKYVWKKEADGTLVALKIVSVVTDLDGTCVIVE